jgi:hypothetical protein
MSERPEGSDADLPPLWELVESFAEALAAGPGGVDDAPAVVEGSAAGGAVTIRVRPPADVESVRILPGLLAAGDDPEAVELLEDAVAAAVADLLGRMAESGGAPLADLGGLGSGLEAIGSVVDLLTKADAEGHRPIDDLIGGLAGLLGGSASAPGGPATPDDDAVAGDADDAEGSGRAEGRELPPSD